MLCCVVDSEMSAKSVLIVCAAALAAAAAAPTPTPAILDGWWQLQNNPNGCTLQFAKVSQTPARTLVSHA